MVVRDWLGEKRGEGRWRIEVKRPKVREPVMREQMSDIVVMVGEVRRTRLPELEIDEFDERSTT